MGEIAKRLECNEFSVLCDRYGSAGKGAVGNGLAQDFKRCGENRVLLVASGNERVGAGGGVQRGDPSGKCVLCPIFGL